MKWYEWLLLSCLFIGSIVAVPFLMQEIAKQSDIMNNQINGINDPIYGDTGSLNITVKDKLTVTYILDGLTFYIAATNGAVYPLMTENPEKDYINTTIGKTYHINWILTSGYRITKIEEI